MQEMQETWVQSLGQEEPLEEGMATHSSILAWKIPWTEEPGGLQYIASQRVRCDWEININLFSWWRKYKKIFEYFKYDWNNLAHGKKGQVLACQHTSWMKVP